MADTFNRRGTAVTIFPESAIDAFGQPISVQPSTVIDVKHIDDKNEQLIEELLEVNATTVLNVPTASVDMTVTTDVGSKAVRQTARYYPYQSGKSFELTFTAVPMLTDNAGVAWKAGFFDDEIDKDEVNRPSQFLPGNGLFFKYQNGWAFVNRSGATGAQVDTNFLQANWNKDKLDGTGASGINLDHTKLNIFWIDFGWLSIRGFRFGIYEGGRKIIAHDEILTNRSQLPFMSRATLPVRYEILQVDGTAEATSKMVCFSLRSVGGYNPKGVSHSTNNGTTIKAVSNGTREPLLSFRLRQPYNRRSLEITNITVVSTTNANALIEVWIDASLTGESFENVGEGSGVERSISATAVNIDNAILLFSGYISNNNDHITFENHSEYLPSSDIKGFSDIVTITATPIGSNESFVASANWLEII